MSIEEGSIKSYNAEQGGLQVQNSYIIVIVPGLGDKIEIYPVYTLNYI